MMLRPESSVSCALDEFGEPNFPNCGSGPVIRRTPEELGIPRTVKDAAAPRRRDLLPDRDPPPRGRGHSSTIGALRLRRDRPTPVRVVRGVQVRMPACSVMGAEMIDGFAAEAAGKTEGEQVAGRAASAERDARMLADMASMSVDQVAAKYGVSKATVYDVRYKARKAGRDVPGAVPEVVANGGARRTARKPAALARTIDVDPQREGTASALLGSPPRACATVCAVSVELSAQEVSRIFARLNSAQQTAFVSAGLKAALLG